MPLSAVGEQQTWQPGFMLGFLLHSWMTAKYTGCVKTRDQKLWW
jgi:hypothetical protein